MCNHHLETKCIHFAIVYVFAVAIALISNILPAYGSTTTEQYIVPSQPVSNGTNIQQNTVYVYSTTTPYPIAYDADTDTSKSANGQSISPIRRYYIERMQIVRQRVNQVPTPVLDDKNKPIIRTETTRLYKYPFNTSAAWAITDGTQGDQNSLGNQAGLGNDIFIIHSETLNLFPPVGPEGTQVPVVKPRQPVKKVQTQVEIMPKQSL